jgi:hypothetical protein
LARKAELREAESRRVVGTVTLRDGELTLQIPDSGHRERIEKVFRDTGEIAFAWMHGIEFRATPLTPRWFDAIVVLRLPDEGYRFRFTETADL